MKILSLLLVVCFLWGCATGGVKDLSIGASKLEITKNDPNRKQYHYIGDLHSSSKSLMNSKDALSRARNGLREQAYNMGADIVVLDTISTGNAMDFTGRKETVLSGRAFKKISK